MCEVRRFLKKQFKNFSGKEVAIALSGGIDSCSIMFSLLDAGAKITAYSFTLKNKESSDFKFSKICADTFNIKHIKVSLDNDLEKLSQDTQSLIDRYYPLIKNKTSVECFWAFEHLIKEVKEDYIFTGLCADFHFGSSKKASIHGKSDKEWFDNFREKTFNNPSYGQQDIIKQASKAYNKKVYSPFLEKWIYDYYKKFTWEELNRPRNKHSLVSEYKEYFDKIKVRRHQNFQLGDSGIADLFKEMAKKEFDTTPIKLYNKMYEKASKK